MSPDDASPDNGSAQHRSYDTTPVGAPGGEWPPPPPWSPEPPARPAWLDEAVADGPDGPPVGPPGDTPPAAPPSSTGGSWWRPALVGAVVGALVAAAVAGGIVAALDDDATTTRQDVGRQDAGPNLRLQDDPLDIRGVLDAVQPGVVSIRVVGSRSEGAGSGMVIEPDGLVLTNAHVIEGANSIEVNLADGRTLPADFVGSVPSNDIALVKVRDVRGLDTVELGSSSELQVGDDVVAVGNALNLGETPTVTTGIVSALNRSVQAENGVTLDDLIQTDAAINPGNSGGPLVDAAGRVIGVNTAIAGGAENIGFAIAIDSVKPLIDEVRSGGGELRGGPFLGVRTADLADIRPAVLERLGIERSDGAFVVSVEPGSGADEAGLRPGDVVVGIDGRPVRGARDVADHVANREPGHEIEIRYERAGEVRTATAVLGSRAVGG